MSTVTRFFIRIAGPDPEDLADNSLEKTRYAVMGMAVCVTAMFATGAVPAALSIATDHFMPVFAPFGLLWGLFVFNLDRWVVSIADYKSLQADLRVTRAEGMAFWLRKIMLLLIRLAIASLIGLSISEPVVMLLFGKEITAQVDQDEAAQVNQAAINIGNAAQYMNEITPEMRTLSEAVADQKKAAAADVNANKALDNEISGRGGTHSIGTGPRTTERRQELDSADSNLKSADQALVDARANYDYENTQVEKQQQAALTRRQQEIDIAPGLLAREQALGELAAASPVINKTCWVLRGLIMLIDVAPVLLKVASPGSVYEKKMRARAAREVCVTEAAVPLEIDADLDIARHSRGQRITRAKAAMNAEYRIDEERLRLESERRIRDLTEWYTVRPASPDPTVDASAEDAVTAPVPDVFPPTDPAVPEVSAPVDRTEGKADRAGRPSEASAPSIPGIQGKEIEQHVNGRWKLIGQIPDADHALRWRTPYLANDIQGRYPGIVALKKVHPPNQADGSIEAQQEIMSLPQGQVISQFVAPVIQVGFDQEFGWFVVTPYYDRGTLQKKMESKKPLTLGQALVITEQILQGLLEAFTWHDRLLVHMDIKPPNIAFDEDGKVRIIDWGLAAPLNPAYRLSIGDAPRYTLWYAPPEQILSSGRLSSACDIRAVGAVCYAMITGWPPLYLEACMAGMIDNRGRLKRSCEAEIKKLLSTRSPMRLEKLFDATGGWDRAGVDGLCDLVAAWLHPLPGRRVRANGDIPAQQTALEDLRRIMQELRTKFPHLLSRPVGARYLQRPDLNRVDLAPATELVASPRRPNVVTVERARTVPSLPSDSIGANP